MEAVHDPGVALWSTLRRAHPVVSAATSVGSAELSLVSLFLPRLLAAAVLFFPLSLLGTSADLLA